jgi:phosphatidylglycerol---prolipoprotein diacylglyceryl transferase
VPSQAKVAPPKPERTMSFFQLLPFTAITYPQIDPVALQLGPLAIHWYGIGYVVSILFAWWYSKRLVANKALWANGEPPIKPLDLDDFVTWAALGVVLGGRIGYILFYDFARFAANPLSIFAVWNGGMSYHGGMLGTILAMVLFARKRGIPTWTLLDTVAAGVPFGLGVGRLTNFINGELWGRTTDVPWAMVFPNGGDLPRHPSQLYEALLEGLILFCALRFFTHRMLKLKTPKFVGGAFVAGYGLSRIIVEFFREPDAQLGYLAGNWLTMGMVLSTPMVLAGTWAMVTAKPAAARAPAPAK